MSAYLSFEWLKMSKRWMPRIILVLMAGLLVIAFWGQGTRIEDQPNLALPRGWLAAMIFTSFFAPFFWPVLGGSWAGNEYGWGTIRMILTRRPFRMQYVLATLLLLLVTAAVALLILLVVASIAGAVVGLLTNTDNFATGVFTTDFLATVIKSFLAAWYIAAFYLVLSFAAGTIFRSAAVGIGIGIGSTLAEVVLRGIFAGLGGVWDQIAAHFPVTYTQDLVRTIAASHLVPGTGMARIDLGQPGVTESVLVLAIYMAILTGLAMVAVVRRDVTA